MTAEAFNATSIITSRDDGNATTFLSTIGHTFDPYSISQSSTVPTTTPRSTAGELFRRYELMFEVLYCVMAALGMLGSLLSFWVWQADTKYNSTVFFIKMLAISDCLYLFGVCFSYLFEAILAPQPISRQDQALIDVAVILFQVCCIHTTLMSSVTRLVAIFRPLEFNTILSRPRAVVVAVGVVVWSLGLVMVQLLWAVCLKLAGDCTHLFLAVSFYRVNYIFDYLAYGLPTVLLLLCNIVTVYMFSKHRKESTASRSKSKTSEGSDKGGNKTRQLFVTMLTISVTSLVTYPVAVTLRLALNPGQLYSSLCDMDCYLFVVYSCAVLVIFNSSVNVFFYYFISSRFKELLGARLAALRKGLNRCRR